MSLIDVKKGKYKKMEEWERMTKKEFINELSNRESALLGAWMNLKEDSQMTIKLIKALFEFDKQPTVIKKPYKIQSNAIQFDTGSWLYFNSISKCYRHNDIIITIKERYDNWDKCFKNDIMAYWVGDKIE